ncbi:MAG: hypothetical protein U9N30_06400, partial [Campylobacterota bacterium]|nr:hypothetical protein [Campylobacterota bacterium]
TSFPWWGTLGLLLILVSWVVAWNRFSLFQILQPYTFLPLWLGCILFINSLSYFRSGSCLLTGRPVYFFILFPVSGCFWWFFEYLNRFVQNWYYLGIDDFSAIEYVFHASLSFSTVLPAVLSTEELLASFSRLTEPLKTSFVICCWRNRFINIGVLSASAIGLIGIGIWPDYLFPLLWLSPLLIMITLQKMMGRATVFDSLGQGDWRSVWLPALAALFCGFFWELWNVKSYAHWVYSIPFVQKIHIFEMPILGYLGYLPFGLECKAVALLVEEVPQKECESKKLGSSHLAGCVIDAVRNKSQKRTVADGKRFSL